MCISMYVYNFIYVAVQNSFSCNDFAQPIFFMLKCSVFVVYDERSHYKIFAKLQCAIMAKQQGSTFAK